MLEDKLNQDLKEALLAGDKITASTIRSLKSAVLYAKIATNSRQSSMPENVMVQVLQKEAKKRQESADLYKKGGSLERAESELHEKAIIERYLPQQLSEAEVGAVVDEVIRSFGDLAQMGPVITKVKAEIAGAADGALIARLVRDKLKT